MADFLSKDNGNCIKDKNAGQDYPEGPVERVTPGPLTFHNEWAGTMDPHRSKNPIAQEPDRLGHSVYYQALGRPERVPAWRTIEN